MVVVIPTASQIPGILEVTRSLLDSDHGEEALLESYTRNLHAIGEHHLDQAPWSDYHDKGESDIDYIIMEKDDDNNPKRPGCYDDNFFYFRATATHKHSSGSKPKGENETVA